MNTIFLQVSIKITKSFVPAVFDEFDGHSLQLEYMYVFQKDKKKIQ